MAKIILVASGKGGVGKSTVTAGLGRAFTAMGKRVLLIDCDAGLGSLSLLFPVQSGLVYSWADVLSGACAPADAAVQLSAQLYLLPAPGRYIGKEELPVSGLKELTDAFSEEFDYILMDAPAGLGGIVRACAQSAENALVIATADEISVRGANAVKETLMSCAVADCLLIINRYDVKAVKKKQLLTVDEIINKTAVRLIGIVPEDGDVMYSSVTMKTGARCDAAIRRIADRLDGKKVKLTISSLK